MSKNCGICGYKFKTVTKLRTRIHDGGCYDGYEVVVNDEMAVLRGNYICKDCNENLDKTLLDLLIKDSKNFVENKYPEILKNMIKEHTGRLNELKKFVQMVEDNIEKLEEYDSINDLDCDEFELVKNGDINLDHRTDYYFKNRDRRYPYTKATFFLGEVE